jgi:uncharacterized protein
VGDTKHPLHWQPVSEAERCTALDAIRGLALLGVLLVNLHGDFRVSLPEHLLTFHSGARWVDRAADVAIAAVLEFKAFALFSLLFGVGLAIFADRAAARCAGPTRFLARRLLVLLVLGLVHLLVIWNGDILTLYAVCGALMLPLYRLSARILALVGIAVFVLPYVIPWSFSFPSEETIQALAAEAARVYSRGGLTDVIKFHLWETQSLILPLEESVVPRTWGLMALGAAAWKAGLFLEPSRHRRLLWVVVVIGGGVGGAATALSVFSASTGQSAGLPPELIEAVSSAPLALAYAAGLLLALRSPSVARLAVPFTAIGQMALTNYLMQSLVLGALFYGYGLGLYGRLGSASAAGVGVLIYAGQVVLSLMWLRRYRFGPVEWIWRSLTYGRRQPLRRGGTR